MGCNIMREIKKNLKEINLIKIITQLLGYSIYDSIQMYYDQYHFVCYLRLNTSEPVSDQISFL